MQVVTVQLRLIIEAFDSLEKLRQQRVYGLNNVGLEIVEILDVAHLGDTHPQGDANGERLGNGREDVPEAGGVDAIVVAAQVVVVLARVAEDALHRLVVGQEVVCQILEDVKARSLCRTVL